MLICSAVALRVKLKKKDCSAFLSYKGSEFRSLFEEGMSDIDVSMFECLYHSLSTRLPSTLFS